MIHGEPIRRQVAIAGRVTDAQTGKAIAGALVQITQAPAEFMAWLAIHARQYGERWDTLAERLDRTRTVADGFFRFIDLIDGQYTLRISLPGAFSRYGAAQVVATVARDASGKITLAAANAVLPPTTIKGRIADQSDDEAIVMAEVRVQGSNEYNFSDGEGNYRLTALETGNRTLVVSAQGYQAATHVVALTPAGTEQTVNITLQSSTP